MDITKFDEGPKETIKHMNYLADNDELRTNFLISYMHKVTMS